MIRICHLFDASAGWEQRLGVSQLLDRLTPEPAGSVLGAVDAPAANRLRPLGRPVRIFHRLGPLTFIASPTLRRHLATEKSEVVHAWGLEAAFTAHAAGRHPLVIELFDPRLTAARLKIARTLARRARMAIACSSGTIRRRLIEGGVPPELCVVIRPGVDFGLINRCRQSDLRRRLDLSPDEFVVIVPEPATRSGRDLDAYWAVELVHHLRGRIRVIVPGKSREQARITRLDRTGLDSRVVVSPGERFAFEELVAFCDALVIIPRDDTPTTSIAWAMAAGVAVIGTATYAVAELIANKVNGQLFKPRDGESPALPVARMLKDRATQERCKEVARGHAYEVFGVRRYVDQHVQLYENVLSGGAPGEGIVDSAISASRGRTEPLGGERYARIMEVGTEPRP